ncbi:MAG: division plane positioning ATPase MipZ [Pseudomonadota bacterium]
MIRFQGLPGVGVRARKNDACHFVVCGNEKGGSGKSTMSMHVAVGLMHLGFRVATVDIDVRQATLTSYQLARRRWQSGLEKALRSPTHYHLPACGQRGADPVNGQADEQLRAFETLCRELEQRYDFVVIDTPGSYTVLSNFAHRFADTLITPINDSFIDFDVLAKIDPDNFQIIEPTNYAITVREARRERRLKGEGLLDWVVVRNRLSAITSRNEKRVYNCMRELGMMLGYRLADGVGERVIFREYFHKGLTALDTRPTNANGTISLSHQAARTEVRRLIDLLGLPINDIGRRRQETRKRWLGSTRPTIQLPPVFAD